jgi:hypothetical protein
MLAVRRETVFQDVGHFFGVAALEAVVVLDLKPLFSWTGMIPALVLLVTVGFMVILVQRRGQGRLQQRPRGSVSAG